MKRQALLAALIAGALAVACGGGQTEQKALGAPVVVAPVTVGDMEERIEGTGELVAPDRALIAAEVDGRITSIRVDEGVHVAAGDVLLAIDPEKRRLDSDSASAQLRDAESSLVVAQREYERAVALHEQGIASDSLLDLRGSELSRAQARRDSMLAASGVANKQLRDASVRAPFAGLVARREVSRGDYVRTGQALLEVVALDPIEVEFSVAERDSARVAQGQPVTVTVEPYPNERFVGSVSAVSPVIDPRTRTMHVKARIPNKDGRLRPGLFARTDLGVAKRTGVVLVPAEAILQRADGEVLFMVGPDDRAKRVVVKTGTQRDGRIEIIEGLPANAQVVIAGQAGLVEGSAVVRKSEAPAVAPPPGASLASQGASAGSAR
ncbi:MAG TPA: efflux RND transporter periplasmic adaptor subunit [Myxococcota bacterium]|jgi:membrane fusion protein (multidrug efflux system)